MKTITVLCLYLIILATCQSALAQDAPTDTEGCKDSPLITRMPGSIIGVCDHKEFDQVTVDMGQDKEGNAKQKVLEGEVWTWTYNNRDGVSEIQVFRNMQTAVKAAGMTIDFADSPGNIVAHKSSTWYLLRNSGSFYEQTIVTVKAMEQEVTADASSLSDELDKSGHVAVYGIHFDTGKATIQPDSEAILSQIVTLMQQHPDLKLRVEGHTDNVGAAAANLALSEKRAQSVVSWLTSHGIQASRLSAKGLGQTKPVADNSTDDGKAKNRRVELVKQ